jgi:4-amino-4-deoxy-L-arabinose transferase-like glycosyltransferase
VKLSKLNIGLILLLAVSLFIRLVKINNLSLFNDEIDVGYQAFSLLNTFHDYKGNFLPVYIQSLTESRAPLLVYLTIPGIKIFGLSLIGIRIIPVLFGVLSIYLFYKLILLLSKSNTLALYSSAALSFIPWHFQYSRASFEVTLLLSLILAGSIYFFKFKEKHQNHYLYLSVLFFCLSFYAYNTANIFVPLIIIFLFFLNFKEITSLLKVKNIFVSALIFLIITVPLLQQIFFGSAANRFGLISIFHDQNTVNQIIEKRTSFSATTPKIESIFHNKPITWLQTFTQNYLTSLSPSFLFVQGDQLNLRHQITGFGLIFISFFPLLIIGLLNKHKSPQLYKLMLCWLFLSPMAASLTINGGTHATRLFLMTPALAYFIGLGFYYLVQSQTKMSKLLAIVIVLMTFFQITQFCHEYFIHYPKNSFEVWNYGYQDLFQSVPKNSAHIYVSNANYNSLLPYVFYQKYYLKQNQTLNDLNHSIDNNMSGFILDSQTTFINNWGQSDVLQKISQIAQPNDSFILFQLKDIPGDMDFSQKPLAGFKTIKTIYSPNHTILGQVIQKQ